MAPRWGLRVKAIRQMRRLYLWMPSQTGDIIRWPMNQHGNLLHLHYHYLRKTDTSTTAHVTSIQVLYEEPSSCVCWFNCRPEIIWFSIDRAHTDNHVWTQISFFGNLMFVSRLFRLQTPPALASLDVIWSLLANVYWIIALVPALCW